MKHLREVFECFGEVMSVTIHHSQTSAIVVFESPDSKQAALSSAAAGQIIEYDVPESTQPCGLKSWVQAHKALTPGNDVLQKQLDDWMAAHEEAEQKKKKAIEAAMADDGWTVVVKSKGRKRTREEGGVSTVSGGVAQNAAVTAAQQKKVQKHDKFYRFQKREERRNELHDLQRKFDDDKKRVAELRAARNFRPY